MHTDHDEPVPREVAVERVVETRRGFLAERDTEPIALERCADRVLAERVVAPTDLPPRSFATMDGFAFDANAEYPYTIRDDPVFPEDDPKPIEPGEAVRIATGAPLPKGANAVLKREDADEANGYLEGATIVPGTYTYERGTNVTAGDVLFETGEFLSPKDTLLLADLGFDEIEVHEPFSVGLLATGTEIHEGRIRDLDSPMLAGLVNSWGHTATVAGSVPDHYETVLARLEELAAGHDVVMTTGGTSVGKKDYVIRALEDLGSVVFHRVAIRPGKPLALATLPAHDAVAIAIPGKPIGAHVVAILVARAFFRPRIALPTFQLPLARTVGIDAPGFEYVIPVCTDGGEAMPLGHVDSPLAVYDETFDPSVLSSTTRASRADGFVVTESRIERGTPVDIVPYPALE